MTRRINEAAIGGAAVLAQRLPVLACRSTEQILLRAVAGMRRSYRAGRPVRLRDLLENLGPQSAVLFSCLLALPFFWPFSVGPLTTPASALIMLLAWRTLRGRDRLALPERLMQCPVPRRTHRIMAWVLVRMLWLRRKITRPRLERFVGGARGRTICGAGMLLSALLLAVPVPMIPLSNTFPALGIFCFGLGWLDRDGGMTVLGTIASLLGLVIIGGVLGAGIFLGWESIQFLKMKG